MRASGKEGLGVSSGHLREDPGFRVTAPGHPDIEFGAPDQDSAADAIRGNGIARIIYEGLEGTAAHGAVAGEGPETQPRIKGNRELNLVHDGNRLVAGWDTDDAPGLHRALALTTIVNSISLSNSRRSLSGIHRQRA